jgi:hypothetical protein
LIDPRRNIALVKESPGWNLSNCVFNRTEKTMAWNKKKYTGAGREVRRTGPLQGLLTPGPLGSVRFW